MLHVVVAFACAADNSNSSRANKLNGIQRWAGKGIVYCQQQFDCYCQWMNALAPRICLPDDQLMSFHLQLRSKRCGSCSSLVCPEGCGNTFCGLQLQLLLFLPLLMPLFPLPHRNTAPQLDPCAATNSHYSAMVLLLRKPAGGVYAVCYLLFAVSQLCVGNELAANNISVLAIIWRPLHKWASIIAGGGGGADGVSSPSPLTFSHFSAEWVSSCWRRAKGLPCIILVHFPYAFITDDLLMSLCCWRRGVFSLTFYQRSGVGHK